MAVRALYLRYNPKMLPQVPALLQRFKGREEVLIRAIQQKYEARERLVAFWEGHAAHARTPAAGEFCRQKLAAVDVTLTKFKDREPLMFQLLHHKYGTPALLPPAAEAERSAVQRPPAP